MTPKAKAKELVEKMFYEAFPEWKNYKKSINKSIFYSSIKQCALICVDEIINSEPTERYDSKDYWNEVKTSIASL